MNWDVIGLGIANIFIPCGLVLGLWSIENKSLGFMLIGAFMLVFGCFGLIWSFKVVKEERKRILQKEKEEDKERDLKDKAFLYSLETLVNGIRQDRDERKRSNIDKPKS